MAIQVGELIIRSYVITAPCSMQISDKIEKCSHNNHQHSATETKRRQCNTVVATERGSSNHLTLHVNVRARLKYASGTCRWVLLEYVNN